jgi:hypothetical protein
MNRLLHRTNPTLGPDGFAKAWKWSVVGILILGIASVSTVQAQEGSAAAATLFGLPADHGRVKWPLGLQVLRPSGEATALREQFELVLYYVANEAANGKVNPVLNDIGLETVRKLRQLVKSRKETMRAAAYAEATRFLDRAEGSLTEIAKLGTNPEGAYR